MNQSHPLKMMVAKLERRADLTKADCDALYALPFEEQELDAHRYVVREGQRSSRCALLLSGLAYRHKVTVEGARQILSVHIPGDFVDLENALLEHADHNVQALTQCRFALFPKDEIVKLIDNHGRIGRALWIDTLVDGSIFREWIVNVGRRDAQAAMCHLLCEFARRLEVAGLGTAEGYELPMTQEQLADALGITPVHVNRILKELSQQNLIERERRFVRIPDWSKLTKVAGFNSLYLHLEQATPIAA